MKKWPFPTPETLYTESLQKRKELEAKIERLERDNKALEQLLVRWHRQNMGLTNDPDYTLGEDTEAALEVEQDG